MGKGSVLTEEERQKEIDALRAQIKRARVKHNANTPSNFIKWERKDGKIMDDADLDFIIALTVAMTPTLSDNEPKTMAPSRDEELLLEEYCRLATTDTADVSGPFFTYDGIRPTGTPLSCHTKADVILARDVNQIQRDIANQIQCTFDYNPEAWVESSKDLQDVE